MHWRNRARGSKGVYRQKYHRTSTFLNISLAIFSLSIEQEGPKCDFRVCKRKPQMSWVELDHPQNYRIETFDGAKINVHVSPKKVKTADFRHKSRWRVALGSKLCKILWHSFYLDQKGPNGHYPLNYFLKVKHPNAHPPLSCNSSNVL